MHFGDFYQYQSERPFDAIVVLGVMEHLPDYRAVLRLDSNACCVPGRVYLDASSYRERYSKPVHLAVFPGTTAISASHDFLSHVAQTDFDVHSVFNDYHSYYLTCREWAKRIWRRPQREVCSQWDERLYRIFRLYLWGSAYAFYSRSLDAYRVVMERPLAQSAERTLASVHGSRYA